MTRLIEIFDIHGISELTMWETMTDELAYGRILHLVIVIAILIHIRSQAKKIQEGWMKHIIPVFLFWWLVYPLWLFVWPGMFRPSRFGKDPETYLPVLRAKRRVARKAQTGAK